MGAACSGKKAVKIQDSVIAKSDVEASEAIKKLSKEAQEQLKHLQGINPGQLSQVDKEKMKNLMAGIEEKKDVGDDIQDKDFMHEMVHQTKHQELWAAVENNDIEMVTSYLEIYDEKSGVELKEQELYDNYGNSMIHKAASLGFIEIIILLLERTGAKPDLVNSSLATPLHLACKQNRIDVVKFLIGCGVDPNFQDEHGQAPLLICCIQSNFEIAKMLIDASVAGHLPETLEIDIKDHRELSPLNCASIKGDIEMVKLLINSGGANVDGSSQKGCTPLLYAGRGGYADIVRFLVQKGASVLRQDNAGGTVLHHAIEKSHIEVLNVLQEHGVDIHSAIEISDNAGRTPIFEACDSHFDPSILMTLVKDKKEGGFGARINILNYNGQTPLFSACREGNYEIIRALIESTDIKIDLTNGELFKDDVDDVDQYQSLEEKFFMDAYKNCMTPLHVATVLGHEGIMLYLIEKGANPNLQTKIKGYSTLHLAVLANKPEIIIELLTKTHANPYLPDFGGRTLQDMIEIFIPSYLENFKVLLENLQYLKQKGLEESQNGVEQKLKSPFMGLSKKVEGDDDEQVKVVQHYHNPDDERSLQGVGEDTTKIDNLYKEKAEGETADPKAADKLGQSFNKQFFEIDEKEIKIEDDTTIDSNIESVFMKKVAIALAAIDWRYKELAIKNVYKYTEKQLDMAKKVEDQSVSTEDLVRASVAAISITCKEKVIKVFSVSLQLLNLLVSSTKIEKTDAAEVFKNCIIEKNIVLKLLQKSEEGNTRITNKIHESLLDLSFNPEIGEALTSSFILQRIQAHNRASQLKQAQKKQEKEEEKIIADQTTKIETEAQLGSYKGLLAQLALLYKFINSFGINSKTRGPLSVRDILKSVMPAIAHPNQDVRNASGKILIDVQKLSGCVTEDELSSLSDKAKATILEKIKKVEVEKNLNTDNPRDLLKYGKWNMIDAIQEEENDGDETVRVDVPQTFSTNVPPTPSKAEAMKKQLIELKAIIDEKGNSKEWQEREQALKALEQLFQDKNGILKHNHKEIYDSQFLQTCLILLKQCLEENNMTIYLQGVEVASKFFDKALGQDTVYQSLYSLLQPLVLRTTDTNTRVRKQTVDLINQIWDVKFQTNKKDNLKLNQIRDSQEGSEMSKGDTIIQIIAQVICDNQLGEKAIIGRLGLFIKRAQMIEGQRDLISQPLQMVLGKNYEQLTEFACQWIQHKNTKIRQNALKLIIEICRINCMDPRGLPFKKRIINFILALRPQQRDPLVLKINETCMKDQMDEVSPTRDASSIEQYININELDLITHTKNRASSMDARKRLQSASRGSNRGARAAVGPAQSMLPSIGVVQQSNVGGRGMGLAQPTIVLPFSEPLSEEQKNQHQDLIDFFGLQIMTCFLSKTWATRAAAIEKVVEQIHNIDPNRRDAMSCEINKQNMPAEINFKTFLELTSLGLKDPVLKNYISILELFQKALPTFFRYIQPHEIKGDLNKIIREILQKTTDMKQKIRESSTNFCLYLSHQSPIGPLFMVTLIIEELGSVQTESAAATAPNPGTDVPNKKKDKSNVAANFGNSHFISACLGLITEYQNQSKLFAPETGQDELLGKLMDQVNLSLRHNNPQVRKEAEKLFKTIHVEYGQKAELMLVNQKPQLLQKILGDALDKGLETNNKAAETTQWSKWTVNEPVKEISNVQRAQDQIRNQAFNNSALRDVLEISEESLQALKMPNVKMKQKAIIEIKKAISKKVMTQMNSDQARKVFEPTTLIMRQLLQDSNSDVYLESLNLLKFIVSSLAPKLSTLDLYLMMGSFVGIIVQNTVNSDNMRIQVAGDKVIIFFAKHQSIGPLMISKEVNKSITFMNKAINQAGENKAKVIGEKQPSLLRFYNIQQMMLTQFSIVLCYQQDFYKGLLEQLAETMIFANGTGPNNEGGDVPLKTICSQIINNLYVIDYKLLDKYIGELTDLKWKAPLRKAMIEYEQHQKQGKISMDMNTQHEATGGVINPVSSSDPMKDTMMSFASSTSRQSLFSQGTTITRDRQSAGGAFGESEYQWNLNTNQMKIDNTYGDIDAACDPKNMRNRRMMSHDKKLTHENVERYFNQNSENRSIANVTQSSMIASREKLPLQEKDNQQMNRTGTVLPDINMKDGLGSSKYQFDATRHNRRQSENVNNAAKGEPNWSKFTYKPTGGAGFKSSPDKGVNELKKSMKSPFNLKKGDGSVEQTPTQDKPPLYVPGMRQSKELKKERLSRGGTRQRGASGAPPSTGADYVSKTGFSSLCEPTAPVEPVSGKPSPGKKSSSMQKPKNTGGYVPSAAAFSAAVSREIKY